MSSPFDGIDKTPAPDRLAGQEQGVLTPELFESMRKKMMEMPPPGPPMEYHNPRCPKWLTQGKKACRCGAAPMEGIFEDELERMKNE